MTQAKVPALGLAGLKGSIAMYPYDILIVGAGSAGCVLTTGPVNAAVVAIAERASDLLLGRGPLPAASIPP
jgi:hypothetical protein